MRHLGKVATCCLCGWLNIGAFVALFQRFANIYGNICGFRSYSFTIAAHGLLLLLQAFDEVRRVLVDFLLHLLAELVVSFHELNSRLVNAEAQRADVVDLFVASKQRYENVFVFPLGLGTLVILTSHA